MKTLRISIPTLAPNELSLNFWSTNTSSDLTLRKGLLFLCNRKNFLFLFIYSGVGDGGEVLCPSQQLWPNIGHVDLFV